MATASLPDVPVVEPATTINAPLAAVPPPHIPAQEDVVVPPVNRPPLVASGPAGASEAFLLHHLSQHVDSVRATVSQQLTWFAFACGINVAVFTLYAKDHVPVDVPVVPAVFVVGAAVAVMVCVRLHRRYQDAGRYIGDLCGRFEVGLQSPITTSVLVTINRAVGVTTAAMGLGWVVLLIRNLPH